MKPDSKRHSEWCYFLDGVLGIVLIALMVIVLQWLNAN